jgi:hypothetical protein
MTNKKLKLAAMSVALTACVAAQPMAAHAVEGPDSVEDNAAPQAEPVAESPTPAPVAEEGEKQEEVRNEKAEDAVDTIGGDDITVDYDHSKDTVTDNEDGSATTDSTGTVNRDTSEEKGETGDPSTDNVQGSTDDGATTPDDKDAQDKDDKKKIGTANKSETVSSKTELVPGETTTNPDGSTTTTDATLDTTVTGTGNASAKTDEPFTEDVKNSLNDELGGESEKLNWKTEPDTEIGGYTVTGAVEKDGNKTFTLTKKDEEPLTGPMTGEDIAKLIEADYKDNGDGTYTLTKEYVDSKGQTHTTTITVDSSTATKTTKTTLTIKMASQEHPDEKEEFKEDYQYPSENITVKDDAGNDHTFNLKDIVEKAGADKDGTFTYNDTDNNLTYTIIRREDSEKYNALNNEELKDLLNENAGSVKYTVKDGKLYYITGSGEECLVKDEDNELLRWSLSFDITITDHHGKESDIKVDGGKTEDQAKADAAQKAKDEALKKALAAAISKETGNTFNAADINLANAKDGKFQWTDPSTNKTYTFDYNVDDNTVSSFVATEKDGASSAKKNTEEATAKVTGSTVIWTKTGLTHVDDSIKTAFGEGFDFKQAPTGATNPEYYTEGTYKGMLKSYIGADGKRYTFNYEAGTAPTAPDGSTIDNANFTKVNWTIEDKTKPVEKEENVSQDPIPIINKGYTKTAGDDGKYTIKVGEKEYTGLTDNGDGTYSVLNKDGSTTVISITPETSLSKDDVKQELEGKGYTDITFNEDGTVSYTKDGVKYRGTYDSTVETVSVKVIERSTSLSANASSKEEAKKELRKMIEAEIAKLQPDESLLFDGQYTFTTGTTTEYIESIVEKIVGKVNYEAMDKADLKKLLENQKKEADEAGKSYDGKVYTWYRGSDRKYYRADQVEDTKTDWWGTQIQVNGKWIDVWGTYESKNKIGHLDLATDSNLTLKDGTETDAVLMRDNMKFLWNQDAEKLLDGEGTEAKFMDQISYDNEDNKTGKGHYEYPRTSWGNNNWIAPNSDQYPTESAYYKLTGTVAYDSLKQSDGTTCKFRSEDEAQWYLDRYMSNLSTEEKKGLNPQIVTMYTDQNYTEQGKIYKVYLRTSDLTTYGYMSKDSNTCVNSSYGTDRGRVRWAGGFDLRIDDLTQIDEKTITAHGRNVYTCTGTLSKITSKLEEFSKELNLIPTHKTTTSYEYQVTGGDNGQFGSYDQTYTQNKTYETAVKGTDSSSYVTYKTWQDTTATWKDVLNKITGFFKFNYTSTDDAKVTEATKKTDVHTESSVGYHYSYVESSEPIIVPPVTPPVDPDTPDGPVEDETPDEVVTPETPELPPVQDATPDDAAPETPVLPSDAVLPAVQDALPQTGVNWMAALGMAFSGMLLTIAGAFASLKYKEKH